MTRAARVVVTLALMTAALAGCATRDIDECNRGDRSRCPQDASLTR